MNGDTPDPDRPLRTPRPVERPDVDRDTAASFSRPDGATGGDDPRRTPPRHGAPPAHRQADPVLREAFDRGPGDEGPTGRPPHAEPRPERTATPDPWRDPSTPVGIGAPAEAHEDEAEPVDLSGAGRTGRTLTLREIVTGRRLSPQSVAALAAAVAVVALVGGVVGTLLAGTAQTLTTSSVHLSDAPDDVDPAANPVGDVVSRVQPAVVNIQVDGPQAHGEGSGVVIDPHGYIVTNDHVVSLEGQAKDDSPREVVFSDGSRVPAKVVGTDPKSDIAVIKVDGVANPTVATLGHSDQVQVGQPVITMGSPLGLTKTVTEGIVSATHRAIAEGEGGDVVIDAIQTDAAINKGNSGGPLVDLSGAVIGINTMMISETGGWSGLGFAVPVDDVRTIAESLMKTGTMRHATLDVNARTAANGAVDGAEIVNVKKDGAGEKAGLREGDVVTRVGDRDVHSSDELAVAVRRAGADSDVPVQVVRDGKKVDLTARPILDG